MVLPHGLSRLSPMEATAAPSDPTLERPPKPRLAKLLREPLFWAAVAALVRAVVGLAETFSWAASIVVWRGPEADILAVLWLLGVPGYILAVAMWCSLN